MIHDCCGHETASETEMQHRNDNMLLYIAFGDMQGTGWSENKEHTDVTEMSVAVAETLRDWGPLMKMGGHTLQPQDFEDARTRCRAYDSQPNLIRNFPFVHSVPIGVIDNIPLLLHTAKTQAQTTHITQTEIFSAQAIALMSHFFLHRDYLAKELDAFLLHHLHTQFPLAFFQRFLVPFKPSDSFPVSDTVYAVFDLLVHCSTLIELLKKIPFMRGETKSVAAIAFGIASARRPDDFSDTIFDKLENGPYGREYLKALGKQLMDTYA